MVNENLAKEVIMVKEIGEKIGYGHLMELASALWRKSLKDKGLPESGAFIPSISEYGENPERKMYDGFIEQFS